MRVAAKRMQELNLCAVWYHKSKESYYVGDITYALREIFDHGDIPDRNNFDRFIFGYKKSDRPKRSHAQAHAFFAAWNDLMTYVRLKRALEHNQNIPLDPGILPVRTH